MDRIPYTSALSKIKAQWLISFTYVYGIYLTQIFVNPTVIKIYKDYLNNPVHI